MVDVNDYLANVAQKVRKCPTQTLRHAYMRAFREWCQQTQWLRTTVAGATVANVVQYSLGNDPYLDIIGIQGMSGSWTPAGGNVQTWGLSPTDSGDWNPNVVAGRPLTYQYVPEAQFALYATPDQVYDLSIEVIVSPKEAAVTVPQSPLIKYSNDIEAGALAYLLSIPQMPWTDLISADKEAAKFRSGISNGKAEAQRNYNTGAQRARPRIVFRSRGYAGRW
jgi:hypothetical protein